MWHISFASLALSCSAYSVGIWSFLKSYGMSMAFDVVLFDWFFIILFGFCCSVRPTAGERSRSPFEEYRTPASSAGLSQSPAGQLQWVMTPSGIMVLQDPKAADPFLPANTPQNSPWPMWQQQQWLEQQQQQQQWQPHQQQQWQPHQQQQWQ